jgi:predicted PurR-regulated permease PerM
MPDEGLDRRPLGEGGGFDRHPGGIMQPLVVAALVIAGLYFARPLLEPVALAVLFSLALAPAVHWLDHRIGRVPAVILTVLLAFLAISGFLAILADQALRLLENLPRYEHNIAAKIHSLGGGLPGTGIVERANIVFQDLLRQLGSVAGHGPNVMDGGGVPGHAVPAVPVEIRERAPAPLDIAQAIVGPMLFPLLHAGLVVFLIVLILLQREDLRDRVLRLAGARDLHRTTAAMNEAAERISRYLLMQLAAGLCFGIPVGIGLAAIGIPNALLWGMLGIVLRFVPYIGGPLTAVFPVALAIAVDPGWGLLLGTILLFAVAELVVANVVEPLVYSRSTGLSAVAVIAAAVFWTWLWGVIGLLLATPVTVCLVVLGRYVRNLQFLDVLLGNRPVLSPEESLYQRLLARNPEEATEQAEEFARETSIEAFFDSVAVPALALAQADADRGALAPYQRAVIAEGFAALLDNLAEDAPATPLAAMRGPLRGADAARDAAAVALIAARNELDLAAAWLLQYLLRVRGHRTVVYSPDAVSAFAVDELPLRGISVVCLSLVSTSSTTQLRYLVRRLRRRARRATIVIGNWGHRSDPAFSAAEATAATAADRVVTSLAEALAAIEAALPSSDIRPRSDNEPEAPPDLKALTGP